nr:hypothetical protein [Tanacetum cinerariifolium]
GHIGVCGKCYCTGEVQELSWGRWGYSSEKWRESLFEVVRARADIYQIDMDHAAKVLSTQEDEPEIQEAVEVVTTSKLITKVVAAVSETVSAAVVPATTVTPALVKVAVSSTRQRSGVVIRCWVKSFINSYNLSTASFWS